MTTREDVLRKWMEELASGWSWYPSTGMAQRALAEADALPSDAERWQQACANARDMLDVARSDTTEGAWDAVSDAYDYLNAALEQGDAQSGPTT